MDWYFIFVSHFQISSIKFRAVPLCLCVKVLASSVWKQLQSVHFEDCKDIILADLAVMTQLEELIIGRCCLLTQASRLLFECKRPSLIELQLHCSHIGVSDAGSNFTWDDVPNLWHNLVQLSISSPNPGLTPNKVRQIVPQFKKLVKLQLSNVNLRYAEDKKLAYQLIDELEWIGRGTCLEFISPQRGATPCRVI